MSKDIVHSVAQKIWREAQDEARIHCKTFAERPIWRRVSVMNIASRETFAQALVLSADMAEAFKVKNEQGCYHPMPLDEAWLAFKKAFGLDDTDYSFLNIRGAR